MRPKLADSPESGPMRSRDKSNKKMSEAMRKRAERHSHEVVRCRGFGPSRPPPTSRRPTACLTSQHLYCQGQSMKNLEAMLIGTKEDPGPFLGEGASFISQVRRLKFLARAEHIDTFMSAREEAMDSTKGRVLEDIFEDADR